MLTPRRLRWLTMDPAAHPRGQPHLSSASGLVRMGRWLYVIADDEHHLAQLDAHDPERSPMRFIRLAAGSLPVEAAARKRTKPDLETLIAFPPLDGGGALLVAWGSGSRPQRERAFVFEMDDEGELPDGLPGEVGLADMYAPLRSRFGELNIEAGFVAGSHLHLYQRAHGGQPLNGHVVLQATEVRAWLTGAAETPAPTAIATLDLGRIEGVPLGITDAAPWPAGGFIFTAVAENTMDAYNDGACVGSMIGWADERGRVTRREPLAGAPKVEGICVDGGRVWLVTDADDPARASELLEVRLKE